MFSLGEDYGPVARINQLSWGLNPWTGQIPLRHIILLSHGWWMQATAISEGSVVSSQSLPGKWNRVLSMLGAETEIVHRTSLFSQLSIYKAPSGKKTILPPAAQSLAEKIFLFFHSWLAGNKQTYTDTWKPPSPEVKRLLAEEVTWAMRTWWRAPLVSLIVFESITPVWTLMKIHNRLFLATTAISRYWKVRIISYHSSFFP